MSTKSKHKPVTLAKSVAEYDHPATGAVRLDHVADDHIEGAGSKNDKASSKVVKSVKAKAVEGLSHDAHDVTAVYRTIADRTLDQARAAYTKARAEALAISGKLEESSTALAEGSSAVQSYVVNAIQTQADDAFGYVRALADVKTISDAIELQSAQSRKLLEISLRQFKDLSALMSDMVMKASTPIRSTLPLAKS